MLILPFIHLGVFMLHLNIKAIFDICFEKFQAVGLLERLLIVHRLERLVLRSLKLK